MTFHVFQEPYLKKRFITYLKFKIFNFLYSMKLNYKIENLELSLKGMGEYRKEKNKGLNKMEYR